MNASAVENEIESFRQVVIASSTSADVSEQAEECVSRLNALFAKSREEFSAEDIRFVNSMRGIFAQRMACHKPRGGPYASKGKRRGDTLNHCWRCETTVDARFTVICKECSVPKEYQWRVCPVCQACGCQRGEKKLV